MKNIVRPALLLLLSVALLAGCAENGRKAHPVLCALVAGGSAGGIAASTDVSDGGVAAIAIGSAAIGYLACRDNDDAPAPAQEPAPVDSDGDGVLDPSDQCPGTPRGVQVDAVGCPLDSDGDGVPDYRDECPDTPRGVAVMDNGCPRVGETVASLRNIQFELNSAELTAEASARLDELLPQLKSMHGTRIRVEGHTCSLGSDAYNQSLSLKRARSVVFYLVNHGVDAASLEARGFGESQPVADNSTEDGRERNRRVDFVVIE